jgi:hypothetical protein
VAALIESQTKTSPDLVEGGRGEFSVWVDGRCVAKKDGSDFPSDEAVVNAVSDAVGDR